MGQAAENLLSNPGFEKTAPQKDNPPHWTSTTDSADRARITGQEAHTGRQCLAIPAQSAVEQQVAQVPAGAYVVRCWVKSESEQPVTMILQDPGQPTAAYNYAEIKVPKDRWVQIETFCALDQDGSLAFTLGGMSSEFRKYHGAGGEMRAPILADDCELVRFEPNSAASPTVWDAPRELGSGLDWNSTKAWPSVQGDAHQFAGTPVFQDRHLAGAVRKQDGVLAIYALQGQTLQPRGLITPSPVFAGSKCSLVRANGKTGIRVTSDKDDRSYTVWLAPKGVIDIEAHHVSQFQVQECRLRYGLLPSFAGTDICYSPQRIPDGQQISIPSTQWFVGLREGHDSMLVAVWGSDTQAAALSLTGQGKNRMIDALSIATDKAGFSLSFVEHSNLWHQETLNEDWLGEYVPIGWEHPFPARWMAQFFVTAGGKASFRNPHMDYSFPIANAKTRMWGVWFEDWNHYPFFFDGPKTVAHFEKSFVPNGDALIYFLEPAAADLYSPCEIVEQVLGKEKAAALLDFSANRIRKLNYSTPNEFMYDRPVCATTTRLSSIKKEEKATVGVNLATHLYEFIREIRGRVDQYAAFFDQMKRYLEAEGKAHPESNAYLAELEAIVTEVQSKAKEIYATPLPTVETKIEAMKKLLREGKGDGFDCGALDVRGTAGAQDDLCRRYNRLVLRLSQTAALKCGPSPERAVIAKKIWEQSRPVLRQPTRWEPRRTLYFFEP